VLWYGLTRRGGQGNPEEQKRAITDRLVRWATRDGRDSFGPEAIRPESRAVVSRHRSADADPFRAQRPTRRPVPTSAGELAPGPSGGRRHGGPSRAAAPPSASSWMSTWPGASRTGRAGPRGPVRGFGFGREPETNDGSWTLTLVDSQITTDAVERWNREP
jgi:hypothetical protein